MTKLIQVSASVRVESGARRMAGKATEELLADTVTHPSYKVGAKDALGKEIVLGKDIAYLDIYAPEVWYVYKLTEVDEGGKKLERYLPIGVHDTEEAALTQAQGA